MSQLARRINPLTLFMLSMNALIGSGWLFAPLYAAKIAGPAAIFAWIIGGVAAILIALTFAELSTMFPIAGGTAHVPQLTHGTFVSFVLSWIAWITALMLAPIEVQAVLQYASLFFPSLINNANGPSALSTIGYLWAAILMVSLCVLNIFSYKGLMRFNFILFVFKFAVIFLTILMIYQAQFHTQNFTGLTDSLTSVEGWKAIFTAVATGGIVLAFNGFKSGVELAGETKRLSLAIPLSTVGSVLACLIIYLLLQIVFIGAIQPKALQSGWANLNFAGDMGPFVGIAAGLGLFWLLKLIYLNSVISPLGAGLIYVTATARILYAMSRIGYVPAFLSKLNRHHFPVWAIVINFLLGMLSFLPLPGWQAMVNFLVSAIIITYAMGPVSLLALRITLPDQPRPFKLPFANTICLVAFYSCNLFSYWTGWQTISKLGIILGIGVTIFGLACLKGRVKVNKQELKSIYWMAPYLLGTILFSYLGSFGGLNVIPFGWDFLFIGLFTIVILLLAVQCRLSLTSQQVNDYIKAESSAISVEAAH